MPNPSKAPNKTTLQPKVLLVEGKDEENLLKELLKDLKIIDFQIIPVGGTKNFPEKLKGLKSRSDYRSITSIGIICDADNSAKSAFDSVCHALEVNGLSKPPAPMQSFGDKPKITIMIVENMIEDICLQSVEDDPAMACVAQFFQCLTENLNKLPKNLAKARVHAFLASREFLEIAHFEYLKSCLEDYILNPPTSPAIAVPKVHAFLASRYTPSLRLGEAAQKYEKEGERYWNFTHPAFDELKRFLQMI